MFGVSRAAAASNSCGVTVLPAIASFRTWSSRVSSDGLAMRNQVLTM